MGGLYQLWALIVSREDKIEAGVVPHAKDNLMSLIYLMYVLRIASTYSRKIFNQDWNKRFKLSFGSPDDPFT